MTSAERPPTALFIGLTTIDIIFGFKEFPVEDSKNTATDYAAAAGGPASNAAVAFSFLGGRSHLFSAVGVGPYAEIVKQDIEKHGVEHIDSCPGVFHSLPLSVIAISAYNGSRTVLTNPAINDDFTDATQARLPDAGPDVDIILVDGHQSLLAAAVIQKFGDNKPVVVMDGDIYKPGIEKLLRLVDVVIHGKSFQTPSNCHVTSEFKYFESFGVKKIVSTNGADKIRYYDEGHYAEMNVKRVKAVDTLAAGDFLHGAFCYFYSLGHSFCEAIALAADVASCSVTSFGTRNWMNEYKTHHFAR